MIVFILALAYIINHLEEGEEIKQESDKKNKSNVQHEKDNIDFFKSVKKKMTKKNIIHGYKIFNSDVS